jgi:hypothetical protein
MTMTRLRHPTRNRVHSGHKYGPLVSRNKQRITNPDRQILLPVPMYADGRSRQFSNLSLTQVKKITGILNGRPAIKIFFGEISALYPKSRRISRGKRMMLESRHCDGLMAHQDVLEEEGVRRNSTPINKK